MKENIFDMAATDDRRKTLPEKGSFVKKGTIIIEAEPFVAVLSSKLRQERCDNCFKKCQVFRCSGCRYVYYCGKICQRNAWNLHKVECSNIKRINRGEVPDTVRMIARAIAKLRNGGDEERGYYSPNEYRTFGDLMSHRSDIEANPKEFEHFTCVCAVLAQFLDDAMLPPTHALLEIFGRIRINSFHVLDDEFRSIGTGLYLGPSIIDHSCKVNTFTIFNGTTLVVRTIDDIPSFDWSKVFVTYIDVFRSVEERRLELRDSYYFWCNCDRCTDPEPATSAAACPNSDCANPCHPGDLGCAKCNEAFPSNFRETFELVESRAHRRVTQMEETNEMEDTEKLEICKTCLKEQQGVLHPLNMLHGRTLKIALAVANKFEFRKEAELYSRKLTQIYEYYYGDTHPLTAKVYFSLVRASDIGENPEQVLDTARKAWKLLVIAMGENHPKTREMDAIVRLGQAHFQRINHRGT